MNNIYMTTKIDEAFTQNTQDTRPGCLIRQKFYFKKSTFLFLDAPLNSKANS